MKKRIIGIIIAALGLLLAIGPRFLFKVCEYRPQLTMICHWTAQAEIGIGATIAFLGIALFIFTDLKIQLGLSIGILISGINAILIPNVLVGGCRMDTMPCFTTAYPAITVISILLLVVVLFHILFIFRKISKGN